ncbi:MAG: linear amide C-N hydrolase [Planctomycetota bacterium]|nr:linear amide C-N hydrolase [Planctomycetota bacterium]
MRRVREPVPRTVHAQACESPGLQLTPRRIAVKARPTATSPARWLEVPTMLTSANRHSLAAALVLCATAAIAPIADACTRAVYFGKNGQTVTGRSMDWSEQMHTNMWIFPRGLARDAGMGRGSLEWTSKFGSVVVSVYEGGSADGMNEKGLVANLLYLAESEYTPAGDGRPALLISSWAQYMLDNFATVADAVADASQQTYRMVTVVAPNGVAGNVHLSLSDSSGDSAILEYIGGKLVIHHGREFQVMTNSPTYDQQIALNEYWKQIGGAVMLPGTNRAADRFARASYYINACNQSDDPREAVASVFSVIRNCSVPRGVQHATAANLSATIWRTVADQKNLTYYYEDTASPSLVWVRLAAVDFKEGSGTRKLTLVGKPELGGDQTANFDKAAPFPFLAPQAK